MATLLKTFSGTATYSPSNKYSVQAKALLYLDTNTGSGYTMHWVWQLYVPKWVRDVGWTLYMTTPSGNTSGKITYSSGATMTNTVLASKTGSQFTVAYGSSCSTTTTSYWTSDGGTKYQSSLSASQTTYTVPKPSYTISYNANGGSGAPSNQTKVYGTNITLSTIVPTREAYIFKGWSTSSTATTATYQPGGTFSTNANTVLYAVWSLIKTNSKITSMKLKRCLQDGTEDSEGTYCKITVGYAADVSQDSGNTIVRLKWLLSNDESGIININQAEGSTVIINQNELVLEENCFATVLITDEYTDDGTETFEEYSDSQKRMVYAPSLLKRPKLYIKNWYNTKVSEYGDSLIEFPDELSNALGPDQLYVNMLSNDEELFNNYSLSIISTNIEEENTSTINENIAYADELNNLFIHLYSSGEWNDNSNPLTGTSSAHIMDIAHSALSGFYFSVPDGTVIQRIEKLYTYNGGSFTDSVTNELWNITSEGNTVSDEILILQGGNA